MSHYSYAALTLGFDLKLHEDASIVLPTDATSVTFNDREGTIVMVEGSRSTLVETLRAAGYRVVLGALEREDHDLPNH